MSASPASRETVEIIRADPDLACGVPDEQLPKAAAASVASVLRLRTGPWQPPRPSNGDDGGFGLLVLGGFMVRRLGPAEHSGAELVGPGDLLRPWAEFGSNGGIQLDPRWTVIQDARLALIGPAFAHRVARYPAIASNLIGRALDRARELAVQSTIVHQRPIERRLELLFVLLAQRWGRVCPDGLRLRLPLTHSVIADLLATRRPTISSALGTLADAGRLLRTDEGWLLRRDPSRLDSDTRDAERSLTAHRA